jgi:hypothetical protein
MQPDTALSERRALTDSAVADVRALLGPSRLTAKFGKMRPEDATDSWGCCYVAAEAVAALVGRDTVTPMTVAQWVKVHPRITGPKGIPLCNQEDRLTHWFLVDKLTGDILDPTEDQFETLPDYDKGVGRGFLTKNPSRRAREILSELDHLPGIGWTSPR